jgi:FkbM family methyltransferase
MARKTQVKTQAKVRARTRKKPARPPDSPASPASDLVPQGARQSDSSVATLQPAPPILTNGHIALKRCRHGWFMYNRNDQFVGRSLDHYGEWCEAELEILTPLLRPGRVVLDVGAFIGTHTVFFAQKVGPGGRVYAIEPQRHAFQMLCGNVALNALTNVKCLPYVAAATAGWRQLGEVPPTRSGNFGGTQALVVPRGEQTRMIRIDDLELQRCDVIKIDVEGMEAEVIAGAEATLGRFRPVIYCENNRKESSPAILQALSRLGYKAWWHLVNYYNPRNFFAVGENVFARYWPEANILCVPDSAKVVVKNLQEVAGPDDDWQKALERLRGPARA